MIGMRCYYLLTFISVERKKNKWFRLFLANSVFVNLWNEFSSTPLLRVTSHSYSEQRRWQNHVVVYITVILVTFDISNANRFRQSWSVVWPICMAFHWPFHFHWNFLICDDSVRDCYQKLTEHSKRAHEFKRKQNAIGCQSMQFRIEF